MELLLILTYTAITIAIFKIFKIPLTKWSVPTAALGGVLILGCLITVMNYNHPYTEICRNYFTTTPIVSQVRGIVIEVNVKPNTRVKKGDALFKIESETYKDKVLAIKARLKSAQKPTQRAPKSDEEEACWLPFSKNNATLTLSVFSTRGKQRQCTHARSTRAPQRTVSLGSTTDVQATGSGASYFQRSNALRPNHWKPILWLRFCDDTNAVRRSTQRANYALNLLWRP